MVAFFILLALVVALGLYIMGIYNRLVALKNRYENAFAQIQVQLKRRYDLIPTLVETAKAYMKHEKETLEEVVNARNAASSALDKAKAEDAGAIQELANANTSLAQQMSKFNLLVEAYPDLKANENMMKLHEELTTTENKVSFARQSYNDAVMEYNTYRQSFPPNVLADRFGHTKDATLLEFEDSKEIQEMPKVEF